MEKKKGTNPKSLGWLFEILVLVGSLILLPFAEAKDWPTKTITVYVGMTPGGIAGTSTRVVVSEMSKILGVPIVVIEIGGGGGGIAAENVFRAPNDGYTWYGQGTALGSLGVMGFHSSAPRDWYCLPTITYNAEIAVKENSPYKTFPDLIEALKKEPGKIPYGAATPSTIHRLSMEILRTVTGLTGRYVPYAGFTPTATALLAEEIQFMMGTIGEHAELLRGKKIRALAVFDDKPYQLKGYGEIPAITDYLPQLKPHVHYKGICSISMRADTPKSILRTIDEAFLKAIQTTSVREFAENAESSLVGLAGDEAQRMYLRHSSISSWYLYDLGVAKRNPAELGIPKP